MVSDSCTSIGGGRQKIIDRLYSGDESVSLKFKCVLSQPNKDGVIYEYVLLHVLECVMFKPAPGTCYPKQYCAIIRNTIYVKSQIYLQYIKQSLTANKNILKKNRPGGHTRP